MLQPADIGLLGYKNILSIYSKSNFQVREFPHLYMIETCDELGITHKVSKYQYIELLKCHKNVFEMSFDFLPAS